MMKKNAWPLWCLLAATAVGAMVLSCGALANGRSPGVRLSDVDVKATCVDSTGTKHAIVRATIDGKRALTIKVGVAESELPLVQVRSISISLPQQVRDGYLTATLDYEGKREEREVKVRNPRDAVMLSGFDSSGRRRQIPLMKCKMTSFEPMISDAGALRSRQGVIEQ